MKVYDVFGAMPVRPRPRPRARDLGALSDEYAQNVSDFKTLLSKNREAAQKKYEQEHAGEEVHHPPQAPEPPPYSPPNPPPEEPDTREARDFSREGAVGPEANLPPQMGPIAVHGGDEVPPPIPLPPKTPGGHAPVVTGVPDWNDRYIPPIVPPLPPEPETSACGPGYSRTVPGGPCVPNTPSQDISGWGCYKCPDGSQVWTRTPGPGCTPTGYSAEECRKPNPVITPPNSWTMPNVTGATTTNAGVFAGGEALDTGAASFAGGGLLSGAVRLRRSHNLGAPALFRPIPLARRPW